MKNLFLLLLYVYFAASRSPPELFSVPPNVRVGTEVSIQCKPSRELDLVGLTNILIKDTSSSLIIRIARINDARAFEVAENNKFSDATFSLEKNLPVVSYKIPSVTLQNAGNYICMLGYSDQTSTKTEYQLVVWEPPGTPANAEIEPADVAEGSPYRVTCRGDVGYPFGQLQLVSSDARAAAMGFVPVPEGCGAQASTCFRLDQHAFLTDDRNAIYAWDLARVNVLSNGMTFLCRAQHPFSPEKPLSSAASTLRVLYTPRDMKLRASTGGRVSPLQSDVGFALKPQESAWIECSATGNPAPGIRWLPAPNQTLNASAFLLDGSRLVLKDATLLAANTARFVCEASNTISGLLKTNSFTVTIKITVVKVTEEPQVSSTKGNTMSSTRKRDFPRAGQLAESSTSAGGGSSAGTVIVVVVLVVLVLCAAVFVVVIIYIFVCRKKHTRQPASPQSVTRNGRNGAANGNKSKAAAEQALLQEKARQGGLVAEGAGPTYDPYIVAPGPAPPPHMSAHFAPSADQKNDMGSFV